MLYFSVADGIQSILTRMNAIIYITTVLAVIACVESHEYNWESSTAVNLIATSAACCMSAHLKLKHYANLPGCYHCGVYILVLHLSRASSLLLFVVQFTFRVRFWLQVNRLVCLCVVVCH